MMPEDVITKRPLAKIFTEVTSSYDLINRIFTFGLDQVWRKFAAIECLSARPGKVLDLCTGTGDLAIKIVSLAEDGICIIGADFSIPMIKKAKSKSDRLNASLSLTACDAGRLPFRDNSFDVIGIAFAFRNLSYKNPGRDIYLAEIIRVLSPGGKFVIVESSQPVSKIFKTVVHAYFKIGISTIGGIISGKKAAYRYLALSAVNYFKPDDVSALLTGSGFERVGYRPLLGGVAALHIGYKGTNSAVIVRNK
jgi:demethylmenaquinone methyltransferase/2-methoxy-6-polyprenyl-1,4-benzoquinol methylase